MYEFLGCYFHGHTFRHFRDLSTPSGETLSERYERTMNRIEEIAKAGTKLRFNGNGSLTKQSLRKIKQNC